MYTAQVRQIIEVAEKAGYSEVRVVFGIMKGVYKVSGYEVTALTTNRVRVLVGRASSWEQCYSEAMEYLA